MKIIRRKTPLYTMEEICKMNGVEYDTTHSSNSVKIKYDDNVLEMVYVIKRKDSTIYHAGINETTTDLPYATMYRSKDSAEFDLNDMENNNEWEVRAVNIIYELTEETNNIIEYNGYQALIEYSAEDSTLFGKVLDIDDKVIFEIDNPKDAIAIFKEIINDYMEIKGE